MRIQLKMHLTYKHSLTQVTLTLSKRVTRAPMTITGLCLPENASQIRFHGGKLYAFSGQLIEVHVAHTGKQRPAI